MDKIKHDYAKLMAAYPQELLVTLQYQAEKVSDELALKSCQEFVRCVAKSYKTRVAGWGVFNRRQHPHAHLLLFGNSKPISELQTSEADALWHYGIAHVRQCYDNGASKYLALNMTLNAENLYLLMPFGVKVLKKSQKV